MRRLLCGLAALVVCGCSAAQAPEIVVQQGHRGSTDAVAFGPRGALLATGGDDATVKVWRLATGELLLTLKAPHRVLGLAFLADGRRLAAVVVNGDVTAWDLRDGTVVWRRAETAFGGYGRMAVSHDGQRVVVAGDEVCGVLTVADGREVRTLEGPRRDRFFDVALHPSGGHVAAASKEARCYVWGDGEEAPVAKLSTGAAVREVEFLGDGATLLSRTDERFTVWDWQGGETLRGWDATGVQCSAVSTAAGLIAAGYGDGAVELRAVQEGGEPLLVGATDGVRVASVAFDAAGRRLAVGDGSGAVHIWTVNGLQREAARKVTTLRGVTLPRVLAVGVRPSGAVWLGAWHDGTLTVLDATVGGKVWSVAGVGRVSRAVFGPAAVHLAVAVRGAPVRVFAPAGDDPPAFDAVARGAMAIGPEAKTLALRVSATEVALHEAGNGEPRSLPGKKYNDVLALAFSHDGRWLGQSGKGEYVGVLDVATGASVGGTDGTGTGWIASLAFDVAGRRLLCGGPYSTLTLRRLPGMEVVRTFEGHRGGIRSVAFSRDGARLLSVGGGGTLRLWNPENGAEVGRLRMLSAADWIFIAGDGRWDASEGAAARCQWRTFDAAGPAPEPLEARAAQRRPGLFRDLLR